MIIDKDLVNQPVTLIYTMTNGLGDYLIMGDVMRKAKSLLPKAECLMVHRANPHVGQWPQGNYREVFFNIYSASEMFRLFGLLHSLRRKGHLIFGLQMAPGSLQGFFLYCLLKLIGAMDYIVDFNLVNADIITLGRGDYILDRQLNQLGDLFTVNVPADLYRLQLPLNFQVPAVVKKNGRRLVGIHPWSRRGTDSFFWPLEKWVEVVRSLLRYEDIDFLILGRDEQFGAFQDSLGGIFSAALSRFRFMPSTSISHLAQTVAAMDVVLTVNTAVVHMGYALGKKMVVLTGPTLDFWNPKNENIRLVKDTQAAFNGADRPINDPNFPQVARITTQQVLDAFKSF